MTEQEKTAILLNARDFFRETIVANHVKNVQKLSSLAAFKYNPFLLDYLANFYSGNSSAESMARVLVYARALGTSINTSFGQNLQSFIGNVLGAFGTAVPGLDIEFVDQIDHRKKYCQIKLGPETINKDDIQTIIGHFRGAKNLARTNNLDIGINDLVVGVMYGEKEELNAHYNSIIKEHPVFVGKDFWHHLTGDENFYFEMIEAFGEEAKIVNGKDLLETTIEKLASNIQSKLIEN